MNEYRVLARIARYIVSVSLEVIMDLSQILKDSIESAKSKGRDALTSPVRKVVESDAIPSPTTWEYAIAVLITVGEGVPVHLTDLISMMKMIGWSTDASTDIGVYRVVHSSIYKASYKGISKGYIADSSWIDRTNSKKGVYSLSTDIPPEDTARVITWIQNQEWKGTVQDTEQSPGEDGTDTE